MMALYFSAYDGTNAGLFHSDLKNKDRVIQIFHEGRLIGFTTLHVYSSRWNSQDIRVVYSGDTVIEKAHWGQMELSRAWISEVKKIQDENPGQPHYWFLLVKGHRTFKYISTFANTFFPNPFNVNNELKPLADILAGNMFGGLYNPKTGIVSFPDKRGQLKPDIAMPSEQELSQPDVRYFMQANPGYIDGDELVCICSLDVKNMRPFARRIAERQLVRDLELA
ncbi:MAG: hypothetical protein IT560_05205 [Alphaproteobacteria bacterium]|nr:hypothetical protein [Alphaproteobacteria bacterium]